MAKLGNIHFNSAPIMLAAWPGMGDVGLMAMDYLRTALDAQLFAELDMEPFYVPEEVVVEKGMARFPEIPRSLFHEQHNPNLVFFESNIQMMGKEAISIAETVLDVAMKLKTPRIFTAAAIPKAMSYTSESEVFAAANRERFLNELETFGIQPLDEGLISGLSGLLLGIAASKDIEAACILASIPSYATDLAYPKASLAIVKTLARLTDTSIDTEELEEQIRESEKSFEDIEERLRNMFPSLIEDSDEFLPDGAISGPKEDQIPKYVMEKIEMLFKELSEKKDSNQAKELKAELDKWGLYEVYENRFLDLFRENKKRNNE